MRSSILACFFLIICATFIVAVKKSGTELNPSQTDLTLTNEEHADIINGIYRCSENEKAVCNLGCGCHTKDLTGENSACNCDVGPVWNSKLQQNFVDNGMKRPCACGHPDVVQYKAISKSASNKENSATKCCGGKNCHQAEKSKKNRKLIVKMKRNKKNVGQRNYLND